MEWQVKYQKNKIIIKKVSNLLKIYKNKCVKFSTNNKKEKKLNNFTNNSVIIWKDLNRPAFDNL